MGDPKVSCSGDFFLAQLLKKLLVFRKWRGDYLNDTSENPLVEAYRGALRKEGINHKSVVFSCPTKKFNRHGKVF